MRQEKGSVSLNKKEEPVHPNSELPKRKDRVPATSRYSSSGAMDDLFPWLSFSSPHLSFTFQNVLLILLPTCDSFSFSLSKVGRKCPNVITSKYQTPHGTKHKSSVQITCTPQANVILRRSWSVWSRWRVSPSPLSLFSNRPTDSRCHRYSQFQAAREDLLHLSLPERENNFTCIFFLIITVAWKCSLTPWTTREVLYSFLKNNKK